MIKVIKGDITRVNTDAIVNAANTSLMGGGGVDGAIHRAGGPEIVAECRKIVARQGGCKPGDAVITTAGKLPAKYVIHTVGPVWNGGQNKEDQILANCYRNSLDLARKYQCTSIAFPNISTGIYGFPKDRAAKIAVKTVADWFNKNQYAIDVTLVCFDDESSRILQAEVIHVANTANNAFDQ